MFCTKVVMDMSKISTIVLNSEMSGSNETICSGFSNFSPVDPVNINLFTLDGERCLDRETKSSAGIKAVTILYNIVTNLHLSTYFSAVVIKISNVYL